MLSKFIFWGNMLGEFRVASVEKSALLVPWSFSEVGSRTIEHAPYRCHPAPLSLIES